MLTYAPVNRRLWEKQPSFAFCVDVLEVKRALATTDAEQQLPERPGQGATHLPREPHRPGTHVERVWSG